jgi:hypothetical protein
MRVSMLRCKNCNQEFQPVKVWQEFHSAKCKEAWRYQQRKRAQVEAAEEAAEDAQQDRLNGLTDEPEQGLTLAELGIQPAEAKPMSRPVRRLA